MSSDRHIPGYMTEDLQPRITGPAQYTSRTDGPVVHITLADQAGRAIGFLYANDADDAAGWVPRATATPQQQNLASPWVMLLREARQRDLKPAAALDELMSAAPANGSHAVAGSRRCAASIAALKQLAAL
jgi:hypothetical protein